MKAAKKLNCRYCFEEVANREVSEKLLEIVHFTIPFGTIFKKNLY
jgi:hypothetical protein